MPPVPSLNPGDLIPLGPGISLLAGLRQGGFPNSHSVLIEGPETVLIDSGAGIDVLRPLAAYWQEFVTRYMGFADQPPTGSFRDGQEIKAGGARIQVIATPGHTLDHCCFYLPERGMVLSADIDLTPFGPWYGHRESDLAQFRASIAMVKALKPRLLISSHRPPLAQGIDQALDAFLAVLDQREARLLDFLRSARTREQIVEASLIYGGYPRIADLLRYWEGQMVDKHLAELMARGLVCEGEQGFLAA